jgi:cytochrome c peroxidase
MAQTRRPENTARSHPTSLWRSALFGAVFSVTLTGHAAHSDELTPDQFYEFDAAEARIGQLLFYDKILSGNKNIACATCHHHELNGTDGLRRGIGEGGVGLVPTRMASEGLDKISSRIPRNAPALWNLGHKEIVNLFHDGRISVSDAMLRGLTPPPKRSFPPVCLRSSPPKHCSR